MNTLILQTFSLSRSFGDLQAVKKVHLEVPTGSIYAFLGPNGAGKTTTIRMLLNLLRPDEGEIRIFGEHLTPYNRDLLGRIGALIETPSLYPNLTGFENLEVTRRLYAAPKAQIEQVLKIVHLTRDAKRLVRNYSLGMRQRLALALTLLNNPQLLILDEPTNGLDPAGIQETRELLRSLAQEQNVTIFLSSHLLTEVEQVATHAGIIHAGRLMFQGSLEDLRQRSGQVLLLSVDRLSPAMMLLQDKGWAVRNGGSTLKVDIGGPADAALINQQLVLGGIHVYSHHTNQSALEDIFLKITA
ncbi:MAG TPA: ABC transporter ATP-binding protein [Anaerolineaceae bacterium]|nr:ABC transporter ATP-binding protein [Anaerolineaceae bacterium]